MPAISLVGHSPSTGNSIPPIPRVKVLRLDATIRTLFESLCHAGRVGPCTSTVLEEILSVVVATNNLAFSTYSL